MGEGLNSQGTPKSTEARSTHTFEALADRQVDGIIAVSPLVSPEWLERLATYVPVVLIGRHDPSTAYDTVTGDDRAAEQIMDHLLALGHRRIVHLTGDGRGGHQAALGQRRRTPYGGRANRYARPEWGGAPVWAHRLSRRWS